MVRRITIVVPIVYCMVISFAFAGTWMDDFEDGNFEGWEVWENSKGIWKVDNGELLMIPESPAGATEGIAFFAGEAWWPDYTVQADVMIVRVLTPRVELAQAGISAREQHPESDARYEFLFVWFAAGPKLMVNYVDANLGDHVVKSDLFPVEEGRWYDFKMVLEKEHIEAYLDNELIVEFDDKSENSGKIALFSYGLETRFDNVVVTGDEIPDVGPSGYAVESMDKLATMWGSVKRYP